MTSIDIGINEADREAIAGGLKVLLADSYTLYLQTHNFHWNVIGPQFRELHLMFEEHYTELATAVDEIAERIRTLGVAAPGTYKAFAELSNIDEVEGVPSRCRHGRHPDPRTRAGRQNLPRGPGQVPGGRRRVDLGTGVRPHARARENRLDAARPRRLTLTCIHRGVRHMDAFARNYLIGLITVVGSRRWRLLAQSRQPRQRISTRSWRGTANLRTTPTPSGCWCWKTASQPMSSPRSAEVPVMRFLRTAFPALGATSVDHPDMMAAQDELAETAVPRRAAGQEPARCQRDPLGDR
jgi:hypothetical protein